MREPADTQRHRASPALERFLAYVDAIEQALLHRDMLRVTALLRTRTASHLPREVREELLMLARAPRGSLRAPVQFLRFQHRMTELAAGGEGLLTAQTELPLDTPVMRGAVRRPGESGRAACDPADDANDAGRRAP